MSEPKTLTTHVVVYVYEYSDGHVNVFKNCRGEEDECLRALTYYEEDPCYLAGHEGRKVVRVEHAAWTNEKFRQVTGSEPWL